MGYIPYMRKDTAVPCTGTTCYQSTTIWKIGKLQNCRWRQTHWCSSSRTPHRWCFASWPFGWDLTGYCTLFLLGLDELVILEMTRSTATGTDHLIRVSDTRRKVNKTHPNSDDLTDGGPTDDIMSQFSGVALGQLNVNSQKCTNFSCRSNVPSFQAPLIFVFAFVSVSMSYYICVPSSLEISCKDTAWVTADLPSANMFWHWWRTNNVNSGGF